MSMGAGTALLGAAELPAIRALVADSPYARATDLVVEILEVATDLMAAVDTLPGIRLLGVSLSGLRDSSVRQLSFEDLADPGWREAERAVELIRGRFGVGSIGPATTVGADGLQPRERGDAQWGPDE